jgi:putative ABC transport system permease protein
MKGIPLAWLQLMHEPRRLVAAISGITFAVVLMLVQLGFEQALFTSVTLFYSHLDGELIMLSPLFQSMNAIANFSHRRILEARGFDGIASAHGLYLGPAKWKNPVTHQARYIFVIGIEPVAGIFDIPELNRQAGKLADPGVALFDIRSRPEYGPIEQLLREHGQVITEVNGNWTRIAGGFPLGTSFVADATLVTSDENFKRLSPSRDFGSVDLGVIKLQTGVDPVAVRDRLRASLPQDVRVVTKQEMMDIERDYWAKNTPIGFVFRMGLGMGILVGMIVVYQILYSDVTDHLAEYATLKAMGYSDAALATVVIKEALFLSAFGFIPGALLSEAVFVIAHRATLLPLQFSPIRALIVYVLTAGMCAGSGLLAVRRLKLANPADIF